MTERKWFWSEEETNILKNNYRDSTLEKLFELLPGRSQLSIIKKASLLGIKGDFGLRHVLYDLNHNFFDEPNTLNCFWAGWILSDGCISKNRIQIQIHTKDIKVLESFKKDIKFTGEIGYHSKRPMCHLAFGSSQCIKMLNKHWGCIERKSLILKRPPNYIKDELALSLICGYLEGDGCFYYSRNRPGISWVGTFDFISWIREELIKYYPDIEKKSS